MSTLRTKPDPIPITVFTGFLGAGKTSIILSLLPQLPKDYKVVLLKNEFGDVEVDSKLAQESNLTAVSEILNGCMCCVLVGQMQNALLEIRDKFHPHRIIIECSGSAFPATLAFQIRELERDTQGDFKLDAIVTVIDAENFTGYEDTSPTARMQASYSDIILINKWEHVSDRSFDLVLDHLHTLNDQTPKIRCQGRNGVDPALIFGIETSLFLHNTESSMTLSSHNDEVETVTVYRGPKQNHLTPDQGRCESDSSTPRDGDQVPKRSSSKDIDDEKLIAALNGLSKQSIWRVKGFVRLHVTGIHILNWAFGRFELKPLRDSTGIEDEIRLTVIGERGEVKRGMKTFCMALNATMSEPFINLGE